MSIKDEVERLFREAIENHPDQDFVESLGKFEVEFNMIMAQQSKQEFIRVLFYDSVAYLGEQIDSKGYIAENYFGEMYRGSLADIFIKKIESNINYNNRPKVNFLIKETINSLPDQDLIKTHGIYYNSGAETFNDTTPNHEKGLFFAGGIYPVFWGKKMNTIKFVNSQEYRKTFVHDVILSIIGHCEVHGIC